MTDQYRSDALAGKRAMVTGAARGIGEATVRQLASMGADILIVDLNAERANAVAADLKAQGTKAEATTVDLTDRAATLDFARNVGKLDILVNNAAPAQTSADFLDIPDSEWELQFAVIMWAPLILSREIGRAMSESGGGAIVNISSMSVKNPVPYVAPYAAAKSALEIITRVTAAELGPKGVRANAVAPTFVPTERNRPVWERMGVSEEAARTGHGGTMATTSDVADVIAWLCSPASSYVNGQVLYVDRGALSAT
ncbi:MAG: SDR family oxidoreductase [Acidimicrobiales bacterium]|nr:SDR family oxidoreductase [Acidimicrobiales bacterium]